MFKSFICSRFREKFVEFIQKRSLNQFQISERESFPNVISLYIKKQTLSDHGKFVTEKELFSKRDGIFGQKGQVIYSIHHWNYFSNTQLKWVFVFIDIFDFLEKPKVLKCLLSRKTRNLITFLFSLHDNNFIYIRKFINEEKSISLRTFYYVHLCRLFSTKYCKVVNDEFKISLLSCLEFLDMGGKLRCDEYLGLLKVNREINSEPKKFTGELYYVYGHYGSKKLMEERIQSIGINNYERIRLKKFLFFKNFPEKSFFAKKIVKSFIISNEDFFDSFIFKLFIGCEEDKKKERNRLEIFFELFTTYNEKIITKPDFIVYFRKVIRSIKNNINKKYLQAFKHHFKLFDKEFFVFVFDLLIEKGIKSFYFFVGAYFQIVGVPNNLFSLLLPFIKERKFEIPSIGINIYSLLTYSKKVPKRRLKLFLRRIFFFCDEEEFFYLTKKLFMHNYHNDFNFEVMNIFVKRIFLLNENERRDFVENVLKYPIRYLHCDFKKVFTKVVLDFLYEEINEVYNLTIALRVKNLEKGVSKNFFDSKKEVKHKETKWVKVKEKSECSTQLRGKSKKSKIEYSVKKIKSKNLDEELVKRKKIECPVIIGSKNLNVKCDTNDMFFNQNEDKRRRRKRIEYKKRKKRERRENLLMKNKRNKHKKIKKKKKIKQNFGDLVFFVKGKLKNLWGIVFKNFEIIEKKDDESYLNRVTPNRNNDFGGKINKKKLKKDPKPRKKENDLNFPGLPNKLRVISSNRKNVVEIEDQKRKSANNALLESQFISKILLYYNLFVGENKKEFWKRVFPFFKNWELFEKFYDLVEDKLSFANCFFKEDISKFIDILMLNGYEFNEKKKKIFHIINEIENNFIFMRYYNKLEYTGMSNSKALVRKRIRRMEGKYHPAKRIRFNDLFRKIKHLKKKKIISIFRNEKYPELSICCYISLRKNWDDITKMCRSLIINEERGEVVAVGFQKFFSNDHIKKKSRFAYHKIKDELGEMTEKYDGSLVVAFKYKGELLTSTKRVFFSPQAKWAKNYLTKNSDISLFQDGYSYLFECIYEDNLILVEYDFEGLVLLSIFADNGLELPFPYVVAFGKKIGCKVLEKKICTLSECVSDVTVLKSRSTLKEGFVFRIFSTGERIKVVSYNYIQKKRRIMEISPLKIWKKMLIFQADYFHLLLVDTINCSKFSNECFKIVHKLRESINCLVEKVHQNRNNETIEDEKIRKLVQTLKLRKSDLGTIVEKEIKDILRFEIFQILKVRVFVL